MGSRLQDHEMIWHRSESVLGARWELHGENRLLAQVWQLGADVFWKLGVFGSTRQAGSLADAKRAAEAAVAEQAAKDSAA
jgi:hypothetical protein